MYSFEQQKYKFIFIIEKNSIIFLHIIIIWLLKYTLRFYILLYYGQLILRSRNTRTNENL